MTEKESEWDDDQRDFLFALLDHEADAHSCGQPLSESGHPDADPNNPDKKYTYQASNPIVCFACEVREKAIKRYEKRPNLKDRNVNAIVRRVELS